MSMADPHVRDSLLLDGPLPMRPRDARRWVSARCADLSIEPDGVDLPLLVSELVTNACVHGSDPITIRLDATRARIRFEVEDSYHALPEVQQPSVRDAQGRGMLIVDSLSPQWGTKLTPAGKVVWIEVPAAAQGPGTAHPVGRP